MHEADAPGDEAGVAKAWVLEVSTWDKRSLSITFHNENLAHEHAVKILTVQEQILEVLDAAMRAGFDFRVVEA